MGLINSVGIDLKGMNDTLIGGFFFLKKRRGRGKEKEKGVEDDGEVR